MTALADLQAAVVAVKASIDAAITLITAMHADPTAVSAADVETAVTALNEAHAALDAVVTLPAPTPVTLPTP